MDEHHNGFSWGGMLGMIRMAEANLTRLVGLVLLDRPEGDLQNAVDQALICVERLPGMTSQLCEVRREIAREAAKLKEDKGDGV